MTPATGTIRIRHLVDSTIQETIRHKIFAVSAKSKVDRLHGEEIALMMILQPINSVTLALAGTINTQRGVLASIMTKTSIAKSNAVPVEEELGLKELNLLLLNARAI